MGSVIDFRRWIEQTSTPAGYFALIDEFGREIPVTEERLQKSLTLAESLESLCAPVAKNVGAASASKPRMRAPVLVSSSEMSTH